MKGTIIFISFIVIALSSNAFSRKDFVFISDATIPKTEKAAIIILPGFGSKVQGTDSIIAFFIKTGYDVYVPDYISRKTINHCVNNLDEFIIENDLKAYSSLNVFSYIVGAWTLNKWIEKNPQNNINCIVYDRSPLQERAPYALVKDMPFLIRLFAGKVMKEFSNTPYPTMTNDQIKIGILIENRATKLINKHKESAMSLGTISWDPKDLKQPYTDACYLALNHDDMYKEFQVFGNDIIYFFKNNSFSRDAQRVPFLEDPFANFTE